MYTIVSKLSGVGGIKVDKSWAQPTLVSVCSHGSLSNLSCVEEEEDNEELQSISRVNTDNCSTAHSGLCSNFPAAVRSEIS